MKTLLRRGALGLTAGALSVAGLMPAAHARAGVPVPIADAGSVVAWGSTDSTVNTVPSSLNGVPVTAIAGGNNFSLALAADGTVTEWGTAGGMAVPTGLSGVTAIAAGGTAALALKSDGTVVGWGSASSGIPTVPDGLTGVTSIDVGAGSVAAAVKSDGTVIEWGTSATTGSWPVPNGLTDVKQVAIGSFDVVALKNDGTVVTWGSDPTSKGFLTVPPEIQGHVVAVGAGGQNSAALLADGTVRVFGADGTTAQPAGLSGQKVTDIDVGSGLGSAPIVARTQSGQAFAWGGSSTTMTTVPTTLDGQPVATVAAGSTHALALVTSYRTLTEAAITGTPKLGQTLTLTPATFSLTPDSVSTQWLANGAPIAGATGATLPLTADQVGKQISVVQTAVRGTETLTSTSHAVGPVAKADAPLVAKADATLAVKVSPKKLTKAKLKKAKAKVTVTDDNLTPTGTVTIYFKHKSVAAATLSNGQATLKLKKLKKLAKNKMKLKLQISYSGDATTNTATAKTTLKLKH